MKLAGKQVSMIGVGISAVAAIAAVLYYRSRSGGSEESGADMGGGFPYFQTAALPSSGGGSGTTTVVAAPTTPAPDLTAVLDASFGSIFGDLVSQQSSQLSDSAAATGAMAPRYTPVATKGYYKPIVGGGYEFNIQNVTGGHLNWLKEGGISTETIYQDYFSGNSTGGGSQVPAVT